jgi:hypothetical protein
MQIDSLKGEHTMTEFGRNPYQSETKKEASQPDRASDDSSYDSEREAKKAADLPSEQIKTAKESLMKANDDSLQIQEATAAAWLERHSYL